jgi:hypothetical protein
MNHATTARLYFLFALLLLGIAWKICKTGTEEFAQAQAARAAAMARLISANE